MSKGVIFSTQSAAKFEISKSLMPCSLSLLGGDGVSGGSGGKKGDRK